MTGIIKPEDIARCVHPEDPRVIVTPAREIFIAAASGHDQYRAVILQRDDAFKTRLSGEFRTVADTLRPRFVILDADAKGAKAQIRRPDESEFEFFELVEPELASMAALYNEITGIGDIRMTVSRMLLTRTMHPHEFPVLNCNWLTDGTMWENGAGKKLHAERGDLLFMKPDFRHTASVSSAVLYDDETPEDPRMLIAVIPRECSH